MNVISVTQVHRDVNERANVRFRHTDFTEAKEHGNMTKK